MTEFEKADKDQNGHIDQAEWDAMQLEFERERLIDENNDRDSKRRMTWFCLIGMLIYPAGVVFTELLGINQASQLLSSMSTIYYPSISLVVGAYFGFTALAKK
jgi:hypothetical protein